jgi:hypothetical protein
MQVSALAEQHSLPSEAALARLCGLAPSPPARGALSGTACMSGDRMANTVLWRLARPGPQHRHQPTKDYIAGQMYPAPESRHCRRQRNS